MKLVDTDHIKEMLDAAGDPVWPDIHSGMDMGEILSAVMLACRKQFQDMLDAAPAACDTDRIVKELKAVNEDDDICDKLRKADRRRCKNARDCFDCAITEALSIVGTRGIS